MKNLKRAILVTSATAAVALGAFTGCETWNRTTSSATGDRSAGRVVDDKKITMDVKSNLKAEPTYKYEDVDVKTFAGVVQLSGFVSSADQKARAGQLAQQTPGVSQVQNNIMLKPQANTPTGRDTKIYSTPGADVKVETTTKPVHTP